MAQPPPEITITPLYVALDTYNDCFDIPAFLEYMRVANRKEIIIVNAEEYLDPSKVSTKMSRS